MTDAPTGFKAGLAALLFWIGFLVCCFHPPGWLVLAVLFLSREGGIPNNLAAFLVLLTGIGTVLFFVVGMPVLIMMGQ